ncbi:MAG: putative 6-phospho-beta-glucosidase [Firmicutes bacterium]|nr:putative 6-phospho-beta-glucosidase [candidate division NPL-UPA2 bacterium]
MKIAVIGGASAFTPGIIEGLFAEEEVLGGAEVCLMDIDRENLNVVAKLSRCMVEARGAQYTITDTTVLDEALTGANYVLCQVRIGGLEARALDEQIPRRLDCIGQETTGPGGFSFAWRSIPYMLELTRRMQSLCPDAHLVNYTNPTGQVARAVLDSGFEKITAICDEPFGMQVVLGQLLRINPKNLVIDNVGVNHCGAVTAVRFKGRNLLPKVRSLCGPLRLIPGFVGRMGRLLQRFSVLPSPYLLYYYFTPEILREQQKMRRTRAQELMLRLPAIYGHYREQAEQPTPRLRLRRGMAGHGDLAVQVIASIQASRDDRLVVNGRNGGVVKWLPAEAIVEVPSHVSSEGARLLPVPEELDAALRELISRVERAEAMNVLAAVKGDRQHAVEAMRLHPLVPNTQTAQLLVADLLEAHRRHLPQF